MGGYVCPETLLNTIIIEFVPALIPLDIPVGPIESFGGQASRFTSRNGPEL